MHMCNMKLKYMYMYFIHDVIGDVERKKERKKERQTPEAMEK